MSQKVNLKHIAKELNLSVGTVSRIINGKAKEFRISDETVRRVLKYSKQIGYSPNLIAKGLQASRTFTLGLMIPDIANPFFAQLAKSIEKAAFTSKYSILLVDSEEDVGKEKIQLQNLLDRKVDGIIAAPVGTIFEHFNETGNGSLPLLFVDRYSPTLDIPYIASDNYAGAKEATRYLIKKGHTRIGIIKGDIHIEPVRQRYQGYKDALLENNITYDENLAVGNEFSAENGKNSTDILMNLPSPPTAIFTMSNQIALGTLQSMHEKHIAIPEDVSLIVFDDQPYASFIKPPLTTIKQDIEQIGTLAVASILQQIEHPENKPTSKLIQTTIIERSSISSLSNR